MFARDIIEAYGKDNPGRSWYHIKQQHKNLAEAAEPWKTGNQGRPPEVLDRRHSVILIMVLNTEAAAEFKDFLADLAVRYDEGSAQLAQEVIERCDDVEGLLAIEEVLTQRIAEVREGKPVPSIIRRFV